MLRLNLEIDLQLNDQVLQGSPAFENEKSKGNVSRGSEIAQPITPANSPAQKSSGHSLLGIEIFKGLVLKAEFRGNEGQEEKEDRVDTSSQISETETKEKKSPVSVLRGEDNFDSSLEDMLGILPFRTQIPDKLKNIENGGTRGESQESIESNKDNKNLLGKDKVLGKINERSPQPVNDSLSESLEKQPEAPLGRNFTTLEALIEDSIESKEIAGDGLKRIPSPRTSESKIAEVGGGKESDSSLSDMLGLPQKPHEKEDMAQNKDDICQKDSPRIESSNQDPPQNPSQIGSPKIELKTEKDVPISPSRRALRNLQPVKNSTIPKGPGSSENFSSRDSKLKPVLEEGFKAIWTPEGLDLILSRKSPPKEPNQKMDNIPSKVLDMSPVKIIEDNFPNDDEQPVTPRFREMLGIFENHEGTLTPRSSLASMSKRTITEAHKNNKNATEISTIDSEIEASKSLIDAVSGRLNESSSPEIGSQKVLETESQAKTEEPTTKSDVLPEITANKEDQNSSKPGKDQDLEVEDKQIPDADFIMATAEKAMQRNSVPVQTMPMAQEVKSEESQNQLPRGAQISKTTEVLKTPLNGFSESLNQASMDSKLNLLSESGTANNEEEKRENKGDLQGKVNQPIKDQGASFDFLNLDFSDSSKPCNLPSISSDQSKLIIPPVNLEPSNETQENFSLPVSYSAKNEEETQPLLSGGKIKEKKGPKYKERSSESSPSDLDFLGLNEASQLESSQTLQTVKQPQMSPLEKEEFVSSPTTTENLPNSTQSPNYIVQKISSGNNEADDQNLDFLGLHDAQSHPITSSIGEADFHHEEDIDFLGIQTGNSDFSKIIQICNCTRVASIP